MLTGPFGGEVAEARHTNAVGKPSIDGRLDLVRRRKPDHETETARHESTRWIITTSAPKSLHRLKLTVEPAAHSASPPRWGCLRH